MLGGIVLAIAASAASQTQSGEPSLREVKMMALRGLATTDLGETCLSALKEELRRVGLTIRDTDEGADAEMMLDFEFIPNRLGLYGEPDKITYAFVVKSLQDKGVLWAGANGVSGDSSGRQPEPAFQRPIAPGRSVAGRESPLRGQISRGHRAGEQAAHAPPELERHKARLES